MRRRTIASSFIALCLGLSLSAPAVAASDAPLLRALGVPMDDVNAPRKTDETARRYAIVIGNNDYKHVNSLDNAEPDAKVMADFLRKHGFRVFERYNLDKRGFEDLFSKVLVDIEADSQILFYYAGHGMQMGRRNYLMPVDAQLKTPYDTPFETVTLDSILAILAARSRQQLVILDSCRDNPFAAAKQMTEIDSRLFESRSGFETVSAPFNSFLAYSTSPGELALDGEGENSVFTASFVRLANSEPQANITNLLSQVRRDVYEKTAGRQVPWDSSTLVEPFRFSPNEGEDASDSSTSASSGGRSRGLYLVQRPTTRLRTSKTPVESGGEVDIAYTAPLSRYIGLGNGLLETPAFKDADSVQIVGRVSRGHLIVDGPLAADYAGDPLSSGSVGRLYYEYQPSQQAAGDSLEEHVIRERFTVRSEGAERVAEMTLTPDACDFEAGDWLDPDGVGIARYPNELDPDAALAACSAAIEKQPQTGRFHYQQGRALIALRRFDEARGAFEKARDLGHIRAWHALGTMAATAQAISGGKANTGAGDEALRLFGNGVKRGDPYAYYALGKQLLRHSGNNVLEQEGFRLLNRSLELGHTFAMNELGFYFMQKDTEQFDADRGMRYLRESAARNDIYGYNNLGLVYMRGAGDIAADPQLAYDWFRKAADGGHPFAPVSIGRLYYKGAIGDGDTAGKAIEWLDKGLERGIGWGGANAALIIANDQPSGYRPGDAATRAAKAATLRDEGAANNARKILDSLDKRALDEGTQMLLNELGQTVTVDGVVGPQTLEAIKPFATTDAERATLSDPKARLLILARAHWKSTKFRVDLY